ncbi:MAG: hypothetical protein ACYDH4_02370 [Candidatus Cryosericum sp.]
MTIEHSDDELDRLLRAYYRAAVSGVTVPERVTRRVLAATTAQRGRAARWTPVLAFALAGASFLTILASSRVAEVLLSL